MLEWPNCYVMKSYINHFNWKMIQLRKNPNKKQNFNQMKTMTQTFSCMNSFTFETLRAKTRVCPVQIYIFFSQCRTWTVFSHTRIEVLISPSPADPGCRLCCAVMRSWCLRSRWASSPSRLHHFSPTADTAETWGRTSPSPPTPTLQSPQWLMPPLHLMMVSFSSFF